MAGYGAFPLWASPDNSDGPEHEVGEIEADELPLSVELADALRAWAAVYDRLPVAASAWPSPEQHATWNQQGRSLALWVRRELGPDHEVGYFDDLAGEVIDPARRDRRRR